MLLANEEIDYYTADDIRMTVNLYEGNFPSTGYYIMPVIGTGAKYVPIVYPRADEESGLRRQQGIL